MTIIFLLIWDTIILSLKNVWSRTTTLNRKTTFIIIALITLSLAFFLIPPSVFSQAFKGAHRDKTKLPKGCGSCHKGHGMPNTPMLPEERNSFCFRCHGSSLQIQKAIRTGDLVKDVGHMDLQRVFEKPYRHPVDKEAFSKRNIKRKYPEADPTMPREVFCTDCHHHHYAAKGNPILGIKGVNARGAIVDNIAGEHELCFKCHANSANLPGYQTNKAEIFDVSNPSYHPVLAAGRNENVPSLINPLNESSTIKCTSCHNNDDDIGPKGPHGSSFRYILRKNFSASDGAESPTQYALCYSCHRRTSILGNESFPYHNLHILVVGTSCRTCHNPHGSMQYSHLIELNHFSVTPSSSGALQFTDLGNRAGECYLSCHGQDHNPGIYPAALQRHINQK